MNVYEVHFKDRVNVIVSGNEQLVPAVFIVCKDMESVLKCCKERWPNTDIRSIKITDYPGGIPMIIEP